MNLKLSFVALSLLVLGCMPKAERCIWSQTRVQSFEACTADPNCQMDADDYHHWEEHKRRLTNCGSNP